MIRLSEELPARVGQKHQQLEDLEFSQRLFRGAVELELYVSYLRGLETIYQALEGGLDGSSGDAVIGRLLVPEMRRLPALRKDLEYWSKEATGQGNEALANAVEVYLAASPLRLIALAYVRYLGDLGGGQMLAKRLATAWQRPAQGEGLQFYAFDRPVAELRSHVRAVLDDERLSEKDGEFIADSAVEAFDLHIKWFRELGESMS
jgi:heme oxygenase